MLYSTQLKQKYTNRKHVKSEAAGTLNSLFHGFYSLPTLLPQNRKWYTRAHMHACVHTHNQKTKRKDKISRTATTKKLKWRGIHIRVEHTLFS